MFVLYTRTWCAKGFLNFGPDFWQMDIYHLEDCVKHNGFSRNFLFFTITLFNTVCHA